MISNLFQSKNFRKKLALLLCISIVFNSVFLPVAYADEVAPPQETTSQEPSPTPTDQQPSPAPETTTESPATTSEATGDAASQASSDNTVNYTDTTTTGDVTTGGCSVEADLNCDPSTTNDAQVSGETAASSTTGGNEITDADGSAEIGTGDALSQSTAENLLNTNIVEATGEAEIDSGQAGMTTEEQAGMTKIELANSADLQATSSAESVSGQNDIVGSGGNAEIQTGTSIAQTDQANIVNTNVLGSNFDFFVLPIVTDQNGDIDLNELWKQLQQKIAEQSAGIDGSANLLILNTNEAYVDLTAVASAVSGQNSATDNGGNAVIQTGDSIASANIFNLVNLNIVGSNFLFGVINIFGSLTGNIIVPSPYRFLEYLAQNNFFGQSDIVNQNYALMNSNVAATADSGSNQQIDEKVQSLQTGEAYSYASSINFANLNLLMSNWYFLLLNNFGIWSGTVDSWENPASSSPQADASASYELGGPSEPAVEGQSIANESNTSVLNKNTVEVNADVSASAISGQNQTLGNLISFIKTGKSIAIANLFNFLNTNIIGSNFFMPIINLFGSWKGNLVFAYPNLQVEMSADKDEVTYGESLNYTVNYSNVGYEDARNVTLNIDLPQEFSINSVPGQTFAVSGNRLQFFVGNVAAKASGSFSFSVNIQKPTSFKKSESVLAKLFESIMPSDTSLHLVETVEAADRGKEIVTTANIATPDPETDTSKNNFSVVTYLITSDDQEQSGQTNESQESTDPGLDPELEVSSSNNTGEFVYPGDLVTFFATIKNKGLGRAKNTLVYQDIIFGGELVFQNRFELGDIEGGKQKKLTFSLQVPRKAPAGIYKSIIYSDAKSTYAKTFSSNESMTEFRVKGNSNVQAVNEKKDRVSVLAAENIANAAGANSMFNNLLYLLVFVLSLLWYVEYVRRKDAEEKLDLFLKKPQNKVKKSLQVQYYNWLRRVLTSIWVRRPLLRFKL